MPLPTLPEDPPRFWPRFTSPLRSLAVTARVGRVLGICFGICFVTGMWSHYQYHPWHWLPVPALPSWGYRVTQGLHVITGITLIPLLLVKLWSVFPKLFAWPPAKSLLSGVERLSIAVLVSSALVELSTGFFNSLDWYPWPWDFVSVHRFLAYVVVGSILVHIAVKLPDIRAGLAARLDEAPALTERAPADPSVPVHPDGLGRRGLLLTLGATVGLVLLTVGGQVITPLNRIGLLAIRRKRDATSQALPVNKTAAQAQIKTVGNDWTLHVQGPRPFTLSLDDLERMAVHEASLPIACVEGWSTGAQWRGVRLRDLVSRAGGDSDSTVRLVSIQRNGAYQTSMIRGPQLHDALVATHLNGERLSLDHGYPLRLIAPNRPGVLQTKWLETIEVS